MQKLILSLAILSFISGLWLRYKAQRLMTELGQSIHWYNVKYWFAPWKAVDIFTQQGLRFHLTSVSLIVMGVVLSLSTRIWFH